MRRRFRLESLPPLEGEMAKKKERAYKTEKVLKSKALAGYQPDFARAILVNDYYTISEAIAALDAVLKRGE